MVFALRGRTGIQKRFVELQRFEFFGVFFLDLLYLAASLLLIGTKHVSLGLTLVSWGHLGRIGLRAAALRVFRVRVMILLLLTGLLVRPSLLFKLLHFEPGLLVVIRLFGGSIVLQYIILSLHQRRLDERWLVDQCQSLDGEQLTHRLECAIILHLVVQRRVHEDLH